MAPRWSRLGAVALALVALSGCRPGISPTLSPRVVVDAGRVAKRTAAPVPGIGDLEDLALVPLVRGGPVELLAVGRLGWARLDPATLEVRETVPFAVGADVVPGALVVRDLDGDGTVEFASLGQHWIGRTAVFDRSGAQRWIDRDPAGKAAPQATVLVDLDGDGRLEFVTALQGQDHLRVLAADGTPRPGLPCSPSTGMLCALDPDAAGRQQVAAVDGTEVVILDGAGHERGRRAAPECGFLSWLEVVRDPRPDRAGPCLLVQGATGVVFFDLSLQRLPMPGSAAELATRHGNFDGERIRAKLGAVEYEVRAQRLSQQAPIAGILASRLRLRWLREDGSCDYEEILRARSTREAVGPFALLAATEGPLAGALLVGYGSEIVVYRAK